MVQWKRFRFSRPQCFTDGVDWFILEMFSHAKGDTDTHIRHRLLYSAIAMTTTSVSTVLIRTFCAPCSTASLTCTNIRVSWDFKFESGVKQSLLVLTWCDYYVLFCREGVSANLKSVELEQLFLVSCIAQKWLPVRRHLGIFEVMMYKCINKLVPDYLIEKFTLRSQTHTRNTRQCDQLNIPRCRLTTGQRSFTYRGAKLWNNLRDNVKTSDSVKVFRKKIVNLLSSDQSMNL